MCDIVFRLLRIKRTAAAHFERSGSNQLAR